MNSAARATEQAEPHAEASMSAALREMASTATSGVTVVCGFPASGKTTVARLLAELVGAVVIDKDTFAPELEEAVMAALTGNPDDRDSSAYTRVVHPHIYTALVRHALTVGNYAPVIVDAPFLSHVRNAADRGVRLSQLIRSFASDGQAPAVRTLWVAASTDQIRQRMEQRGAARDASKLANWHTYQSDVLESGIEDAVQVVVDYVIHS
ncbi:AAA family ATPase [Nocardia aobensis]|uniref:AAA family ATPase n=1 Tax=Nocardia aobensis TaxID=257277 RepID=A0ABW6NZ19_9NOCA